MEKFHKFYLPKKLFKDRPVAICMDGDDQKVKFATLISKSELYKKKLCALGLTFKGRGRKASNKTKSKKSNNKRKKAEEAFSEETQSEIEWLDEEESDINDNSSTESYGQKEAG